MKRTPMPPRKTPLRARKKLRPGKKGLKASGKAPGATKRATTRKDKLWVRAFLSPDFVAFTQDQPCRRCGNSPSQAHHEPPRSRGGTWKNVSPLCADCHTLSGDARHNVGPDTFWTFGVTSERSNALHHGAWLAYIDGASK